MRAISKSRKSSLFSTTRGAAGEVEVVYGKNTKWLLFNPNRRQKLTQ